MKAISEERMKDKCKCEDEHCNFEPLVHFQECPKCHSESYHLTIISYTPQDTLTGCSPALIPQMLADTMSDATVDEKKTDYIGMSASMLTPLGETAITLDEDIDLDTTEIKVEVLRWVNI